MKTIINYYDKNERNYLTEEYYKNSNGDDVILTHESYFDKRGLLCKMRSSINNNSSSNKLIKYDSTKRKMKIDTSKKTSSTNICYDEYDRIITQNTLSGDIEKITTYEYHTLYTKVITIVKNSISSEIKERNVEYDYNFNSKIPRYNKKIEKKYNKDKLISKIITINRKNPTMPKDYYQTTFMTDDKSSLMKKKISSYITSSIFVDDYILKDCYNYYKSPDKLFSFEYKMIYNKDISYKYSYFSIYLFRNKYVGENCINCEENKSIIVEYCGYMDDTHIRFSLPYNECNRNNIDSILNKNIENKKIPRHLLIQDSSKKEKLKHLLTSDDSIIVKYSRIISPHISYELELQHNTVSKIIKYKNKEIELVAKEINGEFILDSFNDGDKLSISNNSQPNNKFISYFDKDKLKKFEISKNSFKEIEYEMGEKNKLNKLVETEYIIDDNEPELSFAKEIELYLIGDYYGIYSERIKSIIKEISDVNNELMKDLTIARIKKNKIQINEDFAYNNEREYICIPALKFM